MRFQFFTDELTAQPKISVDGIVPGDGLHLSHWDGNRTPAALKADTSTEIALRFATSPDRGELARGAEVATNNHFDTDGALSVWTVLQGASAIEHASLLVAAAEAGDFSAHPARDGIKVNLAIQGDDGSSPLAAHVRGAPVDDEEEAYRSVLPVIGELLAAPDRFETLWRDGLARIDDAMESFASGRSTVEEDADRLVSLVQLAPAGGSTPFSAISHHARGRLYLIASEAPAGGWRYRVDWPYWSWAETVTRPRIERVDLQPVAARLGALEPDRAVTWRVDGDELSSALKPSGISRIAPDELAAALRAALR